MGNEEFLRICKEKVAEYINQHMDKTDQKQITANDVYVVWMCKHCRITKPCSALLFRMECIMS